MTAGAFILCAWWCASSPTLGAMVAEPGAGTLHLGAGVNALLPTLDAAAGLGLGSGIDAAVRYDTHGGLAHIFGAGARFELARRLALAIDAEWGFFAIEEIAGIQARNAPFGNGASAGLALHRSIFAEGGAHVSLGAGVTARFIDEDQHVTFSLDHATIDIGVEWPGHGGNTYLRFRAVIPIAADFPVVGYLPWIVIGRAWNL
jgi:hypothetical protein